MENKKAAILVLATAVALVIAAGGVYAMERPTANGGYAPVAYQGYGMMGGFAGNAGGMMGGYGGYAGMMGNVNSTGSMYNYMRQYMSQYWNSTSAP